MRNKIGILTYHRAFNFGAMLQAYALQHVVSSRYNSEIIDYRCEWIERYYSRKQNLWERIKVQLKWVFRNGDMRLRAKERRSFRDFERDYLVVSDKVYTNNTIYNASGVYDGVIAGSDQIWNFECSGKDWNYYLPFLPAHKRFSYAGSFGSVKFNEAERKLAKEYLGSFRRLILREKSDMALLKKVGVDTDKVDTACDPTFLLSKEEWVKSLGLTEQKTEDYILVFIVGWPTRALDFARNLASLNHCGIKYVDPGLRAGKCPEGMSYCGGIGPREFLELLLNATYVVTTSFHGMAFSTIFNKQYYYELDSSGNAGNNRLINIANIFGVTDREITSSEVKNTNLINYDSVNPIVREYASHSFRILFDMLKAIGE